MAFHASVKNPFGKGALINLLRQFAKVCLFIVIALYYQIEVMSAHQQHFYLGSCIKIKSRLASASLGIPMWARVPSLIPSNPKKFARWLQLREKLK